MFRRKDKTGPGQDAGPPAAPLPAAPPTPEERAARQRIADTPVHNPELVHAIERFGADPTDEKLLPMLQLLRGATLLAAARVRPAAGSGPDVLAAGSQMDLMVLLDPQDQVLLGLFSSAEALRAHVGEHADWTGLVLPPDQTWQTALQYPGGAVLDPSGPAVTLEMSRPKIERMFALTQEPQRDAPAP